MYNFSAKQSSYVAQQLERSARLEWIAWTALGKEQGKSALGRENH